MQILHTGPLFIEGLLESLTKDYSISSLVILLTFFLDNQWKMLR